MAAPLQPFKAPALNLLTFNCPYCSAYSKQRWACPNMNFEGEVVNGSPDLLLSRCDNCHQIAVWISQKLVYPLSEPGFSPNGDLSEEVKADFLEARKIVNDSPRGAAALLRLAVQKICAQLGEKGKSINEDIASLVGKGLPQKIQQALDVVRVVGNNAVHPGAFDMRDDRETADQLFALVNLIAEVMISQPKHVKALYETLVPENQKESIERRDGG